MVYEKNVNGILYSDDPNLLNIEDIHDLLSKMYWFRETNNESLQKAIDNSLCYVA